jgi:hypothetical protein
LTASLNNSPQLCAFTESKIHQKSAKHKSAFKYALPGYTRHHPLHEKAQAGVSLAIHSSVAGATNSEQVKISPALKGYLEINKSAKVSKSR